MALKLWLFNSLIIVRATDCLFLGFVAVAECQAQQHDDKVNSTDLHYSER